MIDYEGASKEIKQSGDKLEATLERLINLVDQQLELEEIIEDMNADLKDRVKELNKVAIFDIPEIMDQLGVEEITLKNGRKVNVKESLYCSVPKKNLSEVAKILIENGYETLLKEDVVIPLDVTDKELKANVLDALARVGVNYEETFKVNTGSLKKAIKEMLEDGESIDLGMFGAYIKKESKIK